MTDHPIPSVASCIEAVCTQFATGCIIVTRDDIMSKRRSRHVSRARMMTCWVARYATPLSLPQIGNILGGLDHTSVIHGIKRIDELRAKLPFIRDVSDAALARVKPKEEMVV